jgi:hypothetical protein
MNFESSRISEMNQLNNEHQMLNNSTTPSNSLFDGHMQQKYPISPMMNSSYNNARDDSFRNNVEAWRMEMERKVKFEPFPTLNDTQFDFEFQVAHSEKQRDEALGTVKVLNDKVEKLKITSFKAEDLRGMPIQKLKLLQVRLARDLSV